MLGLFLQDSWSINRLTLNLGGRWDRYVGTLPEQSAPQNRFIGPRTVPETEVLNQNIAVWRAGASYDLTGNGRTALKASYSRYGLQVGIDRVTSVNPLSNGNRTCPWTDPNGDGRFQESEVNVASCTAFSGGVGFRYAAGIDWPYSDEATAVGTSYLFPSEILSPRIIRAMTCHWTPSTCSGWIKTAWVRSWSARSRSPRAM